MISHASADLLLNYSHGDMLLNHPMEVIRHGNHIVFCTETTQAAPATKYGMKALKPLRRAFHASDFLPCSLAVPASPGDFTKPGASNEEMAGDHEVQQR